MPRKFLTTPIFYVNDVPHIGHAYCALAVDSIARFWRKKIGAKNVFFLGGVDENSQKTVDAAAKKNLPVEKYLEKMAENWRETWQKIGISFDDFIRTTEIRHQKNVEKILKKIWAAGDIFKKKYSGKYCVGCEKFLKKNELDENGNCPDHKCPPQILTEENYFFRLSKYEKKLKKFFAENPDFLQPEKRKNEILKFLDGGLEDISITRENAKIGIDFPFDENQKIYVWIDALINYFSAAENRQNFWPPTHFIGKEITRFHAIIWPAMLFSAGILPPEKIFAHGFFTIDGTKMSKTLKNVISPLEISEKFGRDALRIGLLNSFEFGNDGDFSRQNFENFYEKKLAGGVGNLFFRVAKIGRKFFNEKWPKISSQNWPENFAEKMENFEIKAAIEIFFREIESANKILNDSQIWILAKNNFKKAEKIFAKIFEKLQKISKMAEIFLPDTFLKMAKILATEKIFEPEIFFEKK